MAYLLDLPRAPRTGDRNLDKWLMHLTELLRYGFANIRAEEIIGAVVLAPDGINTNVITPTIVAQEHLTFQLIAGQTASALRVLDTDGSEALAIDASGRLDAKSQRILAVSDPTSAQDAATKSYHDGNIAGSSWGPTGLASNDLIVFDGTKWVNASPDGTLTVTPASNLIKVNVNNAFTWNALHTFSGALLIDGVSTGLYLACGGATVGKARFHGDCDLQCADGILGNVSLDVDSDVGTITTVLLGDAIGHSIEANASQTANLSEWRNSSSTVKAKVDKDFKLTCIDADTGFSDSNNHFQSSDGSTNDKFTEIGYVVAEETARWSDAVDMRSDFHGGSVAFYAGLDDWGRRGSTGTNSTLGSRKYRVPNWHASADNVTLSIRYWVDTSPASDETIEWEVTYASNQQSTDPWPSDSTKTQTDTVASSDKAEIARTISIVLSAPVSSGHDEFKIIVKRLGAGATDDYSGGVYAYMCELTSPVQAA